MTVSESKPLAILVKVPNEILDSVRGDAWAIASRDSWREAEPRQEVPTQERAKRNEPCPCGSGKKYKRCCRDGTPDTMLESSRHKTAATPDASDKVGQVGLASP